MGGIIDCISLVEGALIFQRPACSKRLTELAPDAEARTLKRDAVVVMGSG